MTTQLVGDFVDAETGLDEAGVRIVEAALRITVDRGYQGTTLQRIATSCGLPVSSLYWRFASKDELIASALRFGFARWGDHARPSLLPSSVRSGSKNGARPSAVVQIALPLMLTADPGAALCRAAFLEIRGRATRRMAAEFALTVDGLDETQQAEAAMRLAELWIMAIDGLIAGLQDPDSGRDDEALLGLLLRGLDVLGERLVANVVAAQWSEAVEPRLEAGATPFEGASGRDRLLAAAAGILAERGYDAATISAVCEKAGLPRSSLYWHFKDKDDLVAAVVETSFLDFAARTVPLPSPLDGAPWQVGLLAWLRGSQGNLWRGSEFARIGLMLLFEHREPEPVGRVMFRSIRRRSTSIVSGWLASVLDPRLVLARPELPSQLAWIVIWFADAVAVSRQTRSTPVDPDHVANLVVHVIDGIVTSVAADEGLLVPAFVSEVSQ